MKTTLVQSMKLVLAFAAIGAAPVLIGCGGGSQTRTADQWQQEVGNEIGTKTADLRACYRAAGGSAKTSVGLVITATPSSDATATLVSAADPASAGPIADCVATALKGLPLPPGDSNIGDGTWHVTFDPAQLDPTAPIPPAAPAAAPPPPAPAS
ncbi:MAG: hypothetical protein ABI461_00045 [Polyangiaceae bacterium]